MTAPIIIRVAGRDFDLTVTTETAGQLLGKSEDTIRRMCAEKSIPTLVRRGTGAWRIPTGRLLDELGIPYEVVAA